MKIRDKVRKERVEKAVPHVVNSTKGQIPFWTDINLKKSTHLSDVFNKIQIEKQKGEPKKPVKVVIPKLAISDFEEASEKQRLLKYDILWEKAESAYMEKKRELAKARG